MTQNSLLIKPLVLAIALALTGCGGSSSSDPDSSSGNSSGTPDILSGTAAAGAAIVGTVIVKGSQGKTVQAKIEADGSYDVDVSSLAAPYRLRAQGTVGGKTYRLHSYAEEADIGGTVNITPFTDLIVANAAQQIAESYFDTDTLAPADVLDPTELEAQETALQTRLQAVFDVLGVGTAIDLLNGTFSADHTGLDAALDLISIEVDSSTNVATITNLVENTSVSDSVLDPDDNSDTFSVDPANEDSYTEVVTDTQAIINVMQGLAASFATGLPQAADIEGKLAANFLQNDQSRSEFLTEITTDPQLVGLNFASISISDLDSVQGTAKVTFNVVLNGDIDPHSETWNIVNDATLGWQITGDQRIVDLEELTFHCNDNDPTDSFPGACGINTQFWDNDSTNNDTAGVFIASGTVELIDGTSGNVEATIYLGTADSSADGEVQIYDEGQMVYTGDWKAFGTDAGQIDPSLFDAGDTVRYSLYTADLDISNPSAPSIPGTAVAVATYESTLLYAPSTTALYPSASQATQDAIAAFTPGSNLNLSWILANGTHSDKVLVQVSDSSGNDVEIWDESFSGDTTTITVESSEFNSLDPLADSYQLLVRIYAADDVTGQEHSRDYHASIAAGGSGGNTGGGTGSSFACDYASGWDDNADSGLGAPINPNSFADFEQVVASCGPALAFTFDDVAGKTFVEVDESATFNNIGSGTVADPGTGVFSAAGETIIFEWYLEMAGDHTYLVQYTNDTIDNTLPAGAWFRDTTALTAISGTPGVAGTMYSFVKYSEGFNYSDNDRTTGSDGEIWHTAEVLQ